MQECAKVCPAIQTSRYQPTDDRLGGFQAGLGPILEVWEGHAIDPETRFAGSSGGALTALARYGLEAGDMHGVLHVGQHPKDSLRNQTFMSYSYEELVGKAGSRYAPASICDHLKKVEDAPKQCVVIGQPSEITALRKAQAIRPGLDSKVGIALSFFCAGSPAINGTKALLEARGIDPSSVERLRYRGYGWPGLFSVWRKGEEKPALEMTYAESWAFIQSYRPWGVHLWPDGGGEAADISCGDPWYRKVEEGESGSSLIIARTERGRDYVRAAAAAGYLEIKASSVEKVVISQKNLLKKKGAIWGRIFGMKALGIPVPEHEDSGLFSMWRRLSFKEKLGSTAGTIRRLRSKKYTVPDERFTDVPES